MALQASTGCLHTYSTGSHGHNNLYKVPIDTITYMHVHITQQVPMDTITYMHVHVHVITQQVLSSHSQTLPETLPPFFVGMRLQVPMDTITYMHVHVRVLYNRFPWIQ